MNKFLLLLTTTLYLSTTAIAQINNLQSNQISQTDILLTWDAACANLTNTDYKLQYRVLGSGSWGSAAVSSTVSPNGSSSDTFNLTGFSTQTTYQWRVKCFECAGGGCWVDGPDFTTICLDTILQSNAGFSVNPISSNNATGPYGTNNKSIDTLVIKNLSNCELNIRPEFIISHQDYALEKGDFKLQWQNTLLGGAFYIEIDYEINGNGDAVGFFGYPNGTDSTGLALGINDSTALSIQIHFRKDINLPPPLPFLNPAHSGNQAPLGKYTATWNTQEVDSLGNIIKTLATNTIPLDLVNCDSLSIASTSLTNSCTGSAIGSASIDSLIYGSGQYSYLWSNGQTTASATSLSNGTYSCVVTDNNWGCTTSISITLNDPLVAISGQNLSCSNAADGSAIISEISNLSYCSSEPYLIDLANIELVRLIGDGDSILNNTENLADKYEDYTSQFTTLTPNQTYNIDIVMGVYNNSSNSVWEAGAKAFIDWNIDGDFDDIGEEIGVIAKDTTSIPNLNTLSFTVPSNVISGPTRLRVVSQYNNDNFGPCDIPSVSSSFTPYYGATEDYTVVINGSNPPTYLWSNGATTQTINGLSAGMYSCTLTDNNGCQIIDSIQITEPTPILVLETITHLDCNGDNNGTVTLAISAGIPPYTVNWYGKDTTGLNGGQHDYTITDNSGCILSDSILINEPAAVTISSLISNNISCAGSSDGSIDISASGGTGSLSYSWSNGETTEDISNLSFGEYSLIVTDANNCIANDTITIDSVSILSITLDSKSDQTNCSSYNGSINITASGGTGAYSYSWSNGETTEDIMGLNANTYTLTLSDINNCSIQDTFTINSQTIPILVMLDSSNYNGYSISCNGNSDGYVAVNSSGGTGNLSLSWDNNGSSADTIFNLVAGSYGITVSDTAGCYTNETITIHEPLVISAYRQQNQGSCSAINQNIGITLAITGGTPGYTEDWGLGVNPDSLIINTYYSYTITDTNNCSFTDTFTLTLAPPLVMTANQTDVACYGDSTGVAYFTVSGGVLPYSYLWSNGETTAIVTNLPEGIHTCTVTDNNGCTQIDSTIISQPSIPIFTMLSIIDSINCYGDNTGSANVTVNGGYSPYSLVWSSLLIDTISETLTATSLTAGWIYCTTKDDNNCILKDSIFMSQNDSLYFLDSISNYNNYSVSCNGLSDASINIAIIGGFGPFNLKWDNNVADSTYIDSLSQGVYSLEIEDSLGCQFSTQITITEPNQINMIETHQNVSCPGDNDGSFSFSITGGIPSYSISGSLTYPSVSLLDIISMNNISASNQIFTITDQNSCIYTDTIIISEPSNLFGHTTLSDYNGVNISCKGQSTGFISVAITGGNAPYDIYWMDFNGDTLSTLPIIDSLSVGNYSLTINGSLGCPSFIDSFFISEPNFALISEIDSFDVTCNNYCDGTLIATTFDGTSPYNYNWTYPNGFFNLNDTINNLCAGNYDLLVTDANGCINTLSTVINEPTPVSIQLLSLTNVSVNGNNDGSIFVQPNGGNGNVYATSWSNGGITNSIMNLFTGQYEFVATDILGCSDTSTYFISEPLAISLNFDSINSNLSTSCYDSCNGFIYINPVYSPLATFTTFWNGPNGYSSTDEDIFNLCAGTYNLLLVSNGGDSTNYIFEITQPEKLEVSIYSDTILCYNGNALSTAYTYGGILPYSFSWNDSISNISAMLSAGLHIVKITDANGCIIGDTITVLNPDTMIISTLNTPISCHNGSDGYFIINSILGGTSPYLYSDNNGISYQSIDDTILNVSAGTYMIKVKDNNNCSQNINITISNPALFTATVNPNLSSLSVDCHGDCFGANISFLPLGGTIQGQDWGNNNQSTLCAGTYSCVLTNGNLCTTTVNNITITQPTPLVLTLSTNPGITTCNNGDDGLAQATIQGGTGPYDFQWLNGEISSSIIDLSPGNYSVEVTDMNGCSIDDDITITNNPTPFLIGIDYSAADFNLNVDTSSGGLPDDVSSFSYEWNNDSTTQNIDAETNGQYWVIATDEAGCTSDTAFYNVNNHIIINNTTNIESNNIKIFPNPTTGLLNISSEDIINELSMINNIGEEVLNNYLSSYKNISKEKLNISTLPRGMYFIRLKVNNQIINHKILLQ